ncbi:MAG: AraC family transcriptional regulator [Cyclobacteriaceae bacterium]|nr:AraC family transcriptional regulator [Cyclobacteriaceae bacterium]
MGTSYGVLNNIFFISLLSLLFFHAFIFLSNPFKVNKKGNFWLGLFFSVWATFYLDEVAVFGFGYIFKDYLTFGFRLIQYFCPMLFYFSVLRFTNPSRNIKIEFIWHFIPVLIYLGILITYFFLTYKVDTLDITLLILYLLQSSVYVFMSIYSFYRHQKVLNVFASNKEFVDLKWLLSLIWGIAILLVVVLIYKFIFPFDAPNFYINSAIIVYLCYFSFHAIRQKEVFPLTKNVDQEIIELEEDLKQDGSRTKLIPDEEMIEMKFRLNSFMNETKPYLDPEINLIKLAELLQTTPHKLSYTINTGFHMNFFSFINYYRVQQAKNLLINPAKNHLNLLGIAFESGFSSKTAFNNAFKKVTGLTPSEFKKSGSTL